MASVCDIWNSDRYYGDCLTKCTDNLWASTLKQNDELNFYYNRRHPEDPAGGKTRWQSDGCLSEIRKFDRNFREREITPFNTTPKYVELFYRRVVVGAMATTVTVVAAPVGFTTKLIHYAISGEEENEVFLGEN